MTCQVVTLDKLLAILGRGIKGQFEEVDWALPVMENASA